MAGNAQQKRKLLVLKDILERYSDEEHPLTAAELGERLEQCGISADRKSIYSDIEVLRSQGMDILNVFVPKRGYYLASRPFEVPQVRLLMDAVRAAGFITAKKSRELIDRLGGLVSEYQRGQISSQIYMDNAHKHENEEIYYSIDAAIDAIARKRKIQLVYSRRQMDEHGGVCLHSREFIVSPYAMMWSNDHYYLIGNHEKYDNLMHLRMDRMKKVTVIEQAARSFEEVCEYRGYFDTADYASKIFHAFGGEVEQVELRCHRDFLEEMLDCFGSDLTLKPSGEDHFTFRVPVVVSDGFIGTILGFGDKVEVLTPRSVRRKVIDALAPMIKQYGL